MLTNAILQAGLFCEGIREDSGGRKSIVGFLDTVRIESEGVGLFRQSSIRSEFS